ncbi:MAG: AraC family transcriptional regulator [Coprobacillus sp.]
MKTYYHERVNHQDDIPALIAILDNKEIKKVFPSNPFIPSHWHRSIEITLIENAEVILQIGEREYNIENDFTCVNSGIVHSLIANKVTKDVHCIILVLSYEFVKQYVPEIDNITFDLSLKKDHSDLKELYYRLEKLYIHQSKGSYLKIIACLLEIISVLVESYQVNHIKKSSVKNQEQIKEVLNYLHDHYQEELTLTSMADYFHMSHEHFSRQFHHYIGKTFRDYLSSYRLYKAYDDIINTDMTIQSIARNHGFLNVKSFIKVFYDTYHETPLQYRKKISKE